MVYTKALPRIDNIIWLAKLARPFPTTAGEILDIAKQWHFSDSTIDFLELFPTDEQFTSMDDFLVRSEEIEQLTRQERESPEEFLRSPED